MPQIIVFIILIILCGLMEDTKAATRGAAIHNASESGMPVARMQKVGETRIYTAIAKPGHTFAVKNGKIIYMSIERAKKLGAQCFNMSHAARRVVKTPQTKP